MIVWSLALEEDFSIDVLLYLTEQAAYEGLAYQWFPEEHDTDDEYGQKNKSDRMEMLEALSNGISDVEAWVETHYQVSDGYMAVVTKHDHPWVFAAEPEEKTSSNPNILLGSQI